ncbi:hypothetical protein J7F03_39470 [Streptomyces sp. ISL-43]|nr:hypothetical protein [Streptomyces sp. ISL-43]MBT2453006.1 hypothetical protein [Streptomyces sp. ISL-43]
MDRRVEAVSDLALLDDLQLLATLAHLLPGEQQRGDRGQPRQAEQQQ